MQEAIIVTALLVQNFDFELHDPNYQLATSKAMTVKPKGFFIRAKLRDGITPASLQRRLLGAQTQDSQRPPNRSNNASPANGSLEGNLKDLLICYGSNAGTCQTLAFALSRDAHAHGFRPKVMSMDEAIDHISPKVREFLLFRTSSGQQQRAERAGQGKDTDRAKDHR